MIAPARPVLAWRRECGTTRAAGSEGEALARLGPMLGDAPEDLWRFFVAIFGCDRTPRSVKGLSDLLAIQPAAIRSRFWRAGLPSPRLYLRWADLTRAAYRMEQPTASVEDVAWGLGWSSGQSFGRYLRTSLGLTATEFRRAYSGRTMLDRYIAELVEPYVSTLQRFSPLVVLTAPRAHQRAAA